MKSLPGRTARGIYQKRKDQIDAKRMPKSNPEPVYRNDTNFKISKLKQKKQKHVIKNGLKKKKNLERLMLKIGTCLIK
jgi:hypothetical protein